MDKDFEEWLKQDDLFEYYNANPEQQADIYKDYQREKEHIDPKDMEEWVKWLFNNPESAEKHYPLLIQGLKERIQNWSPFKIANLIQMLPENFPIRKAELNNQSNKYKEKRITEQIDLLNGILNGWQYSSKIIQQAIENIRPILTEQLEYWKNELKALTPQKSPIENKKQMERKDLLSYLVEDNPELSEEQIKDRYNKLKADPLLESLPEKILAKMARKYREAEIPKNVLDIINEYGFDLVMDHYNLKKEFSEGYLHRITNTFPKEGTKLIENYFNNFEKDLKEIKNLVSNKKKIKKLKFNLFFLVQFIENNTSDILELEIEKHRDYIDDYKDILIKCINNLEQNLKSQHINVETKKKKYSAKHYALTYIIECNAKGQSLPIGQKKELEHIGNTMIGKGKGNTFYKNFNNIYGKKLDEEHNLILFGGKNWRKTIKELSDEPEIIEKYLQSKQL